MTNATPKPGTVTDTRGVPCPRADVSSYPLYATCDNCGGIIRCVDGTADWAHTCDYRGQCSEASKVFGVKQ